MSAEALALPRLSRRRLDSGLTLLLVEKRSVPLVTFEVVTWAGAVLDPRGREGLAAATAALLRKGTRRRSAEEFSATIDAAGAILGASVDHDHAHLAAEFLARDAEEGLALVAEALFEPTFPEEELSKRVQIAVDAIRDDKDHPPSVIGRYYERALYGDHPYGRPAGGDEASIPRIARADVVAFHEAAYRPERMVLAVAGEFDGDAISATVERRFARRGAGAGAAAGAPGPVAASAASPAPPAAFDPAAIPEVHPARGRRVVLVDKPDEETGYFRFGNVGIAFRDPEWVLTNLARTVLGGSFTSWLNTALRVDEGLTYGVQADLARRQRRGPFAISSYARADQVERAIAIAEAQLARLHEEGIDAESLGLAKAYIRGQFPLAVETSDQLAEAFARFEAYGAPQEWIAEYLARVDSATADEVTEAARRVFPREDLVFALVGPARALAPVAERLGTVVPKRIEEPGF